MSRSRERNGGATRKLLKTYATHPGQLNERSMFHGTSCEMVAKVAATNFRRETTPSSAGSGTARAPILAAGVLLDPGQVLCLLPDL